MFEDALMESSHTIRTRSNYWSLPALLMNCGLLSALIIWPLLHPEALPKQAMTSLLIAPPAPPPPPPLLRLQPRTQARSEIFDNELQTPSRIPHAIKTVSEPETPPSIGVVGIENQTDSGADKAIESIVGSTGHIAVVEAPVPPKMIISSGVMAGNLVDKVTPQYPAIARQAHVQGTVVLQATISKNGAIEKLRVLSGPPLLEQAALDAVRSWRYKAYQLNGQPVAVETTINVIFSLGN
jgi:protein TonB